MAAELRCWNEAGVLLFDTSRITGRILGTFNVNTYEGSTPFPWPDYGGGFNGGGTPWAYMLGGLGMQNATFGVEIVNCAWVVSNTIYWKTVNDLPATIMYGVGAL